METGVNAAAVSPRLLTIPACAAYLSTTVPAVRNLIWNSELPFVKLGKRFLIDRADADRLIERSKVRNPQ